MSKFLVLGASCMHLYRLNYQHIHSFRIIQYVNTIHVDGDRFDE